MSVLVVSLLLFWEPYRSSRNDSVGEDRRGGEWVQGRGVRTDARCGYVARIRAHVTVSHILNGNTSSDTLEVRSIN